MRALIGLLVMSALFLGMLGLFTTMNSERFLEQRAMAQEEGRACWRISGKYLECVQVCKRQKDALRSIACSDGVAFAMLGK